MHEAGGMQNISTDKSMEIQKFSMRVMLRACGLVCNDGGDNLLRGWVEKRFDPTFGSTKIFIPDVILSNLPSCFHYSTEPVLLNNFFYSLWFFLDVLVKCFAVDAIINHRVVKNRQYFVKANTSESLKKFVSAITYLIKIKIAEDPKIIKRFAYYLGRFITKSFSVSNRGLVMGILEIIIENLKGNEPENVQLRLEILSYVANYKYFIQLNLPLDLPNNKNAIFLLRELSKEYGSLHFPIYLILREVEATMNLSYECRKFAIRLMRNLVKKHHFDDRYDKEDVLCRIHMMYLPFLTMIIHKADLIAESVQKSPSDLAISMDLNEIPTETPSGKSTLDQRKWVSHCKSTSSINTTLIKNAVADVDGRLFTVSELRDILTIFFQIIKSVDMSVMIDYLKCFTATMFEQSKRNSIRSLSLTSLQKATATTFIENFLNILRSSLSLFGVNYIKNIKNFKMGVSSFVPQAAKSQSLEAISNFENYIEVNRRDLEINLQNEICIIIMDVMERVYNIFKTQIEVDNGDNPFMKAYFELNLSLLQAHTSVHAKRSLFALLRQFLAKSSNVIFKGNNNYCYQLCTQIIKLSNTQNVWLQNETKYFIYLVLRCDYFFNGITYTRAYISIITACSATVQECKTMNFLLDMMRGLWDLVKDDKALNSGEFAVEVSDLTKRVKNIIRLTLRFSELESDPESLVDAHCSIASSFSGVPELRQMWIEKVSRLQEKYQNYSEAGMCHLFIAALIAISLKRKGIISEGPSIFKSCTPNITANDISFKEEAIIDDNKHTVPDFLHQVTMACDFFFKAERYELIPDLCKAIIPLLEKEDNYKGLSKIYEKLKNTYDKIIESAGKRFLGTYYRVSFYGHSFKEEHGCEYIYKEPKLTPLPDIVERIKGIYSAFCPNLKIIQESTKVKWKELDQSGDYIQINAVKPNYLDNKDAKSQFLCHHNIGSFILETPFCLTGKAHGSISDQCKRITVFRTAQTFPYIKKRIQIINKEVIELTPIEVAIEEMTSQVQGLKNLVESPKPDKVQLELKLQGSVSVTVNAGPIAYANAFLKSDVRAKFNKNLKDRLMSIFKEFIDVCGRAIEVYGSTIVNEQIPVLQRYKQDFQTLSKNLYDILEIPNKSPDNVSTEALI